MADPIDPRHTGPRTTETPPDDFTRRPGAGNVPRNSGPVGRKGGSRTWLWIGIGILIIAVLVWWLTGGFLTNDTTPMTATGEATSVAPAPTD